LSIKKPPHKRIAIHVYSNLSKPPTAHQSCEHVADDPRKIMAALKHPYKELTANIFRAINATINSSATPSQQQL
jgi:hypothetical protein